MAGQLQAPLLSEEREDVESGPKEPSKEENAQLLEEGHMSWADLLNFFLDPKHFIVTFLTVYTLAATLGLLYMFYENKTYDLNHYMGIVSFFALASLAGSAYIAFLSEQLKDEVNRYWRLNRRLKSNKVRLELTCQDLRVNVRKMHDEVGAFQRLQAQMAKFAESTRGGLKDVFERASGVLDSMKEQLTAMQSNLLTGYAVKLSLQDGEEGLTEEEFCSFKSRLPTSFQNASFDELSKGNSTISVEDIQHLIDEAVKTISL